MQHEYAFDPDQDTKLHAGSDCLFSHDPSISTSIRELDPAKGRVEIKLGLKAGTPPARLSLIPSEFISAEVIDDAIDRYADAWNRGKSCLRQSTTCCIAARHGFAVTPRARGSTETASWCPKSPI